MRRAGSVSYTHLDVYKRQEYAGIDFMALSPEEALEAVKAKGLEIEKGKESSFSYTHLDVYKRQNIIRSSA